MTKFLKNQRISRNEYRRQKSRHSEEVRPRPASQRSGVYRLAQLPWGIVLRKPVQ